MTREKVTAVTLVVAIALGVVGIAWGDSVTVQDPEEGYAVDVVAAGHRHPAFAPAAVVVHTVQTSADWASGDVPRVRMNLRLVGVPKPRKRTIVLHPNSDGSLRGVFVKGQRLLGHVYAWRPDGSTLRIEFARALLGGADGYRWSMEVFQPCAEDSPNCAAEWDRVPDEGTVLHRLRS